MKTTNDQETSEPVPDDSKATQPETATVPIATVATHRYALRPKTKMHKLESHLIINDISQLTDDEKDWNLHVMLNLKYNKGKELKEFFSLHTSISEALQEDEVKVKEAIVNE